MRRHLKRLTGSRVTTVATLLVLIGISQSITRIKLDKLRTQQLCNFSNDQKIRYHVLGDYMITTIVCRATSGDAAVAVSKYEKTCGADLEG